VWRVEQQQQYQQHAVIERHLECPGELDDVIGRDQCERSEWRGQQLADAGGGPKRGR